MFSYEMPGSSKKCKYEIPLNTHNSPGDSIDKLIKSLPKSYSGNPSELHDFIQRVGAVFKKADNRHKPTLLTIVKERMKGRAKILLDSKPNATTWEELIKQLEELSLDKILKMYNETLNMLCSAKQERNETITEFYTRLVALRSKIIKIFLTMRRGSVEYRGRAEMLRDLVLNRFVYHSHPCISIALQSTQFDRIEKALKRAELIEPLSVPNFS